MLRVFLLFLCGGLGTLARYGVTLASNAALSRRGLDFPLGTLAVNVAGSFALSLLVTLALHKIVPPEYRLLLGVGFLGGFTTYSTFAVEAEGMMSKGAWTLASLYLGGNLLGGVLAVVLGRWLALRWIG